MGAEGVGIYVLGPIRVERDGRAVVLEGIKLRALLAMLALRANSVLDSGYLIEELWDDRPPATATATLHAYISKLRRALATGGPDANCRLLTHRPGYELVLDPTRLDAARFQHLIEESGRLMRAGQLDAAASRLREGLSLWRGPAYAEFASHRFAQPEAVRLEELRLAALEDRLEVDLLLGRHAEVIGDIERLVREQPLRERPREQLMLALYRSGRQAEALHAYRDAHQLLVEELGVEPGPGLQRLQHQILAADPSLDLHEMSRPDGGPTGGPSGTGSDGVLGREARPNAVLVGRETELGRLENALGAARSAQAHLVLITGEVGIGKSHLAHYFALKAEAAGLEAFWGRIWEEEGAPIYWPWLMIMRQLLERRNTDWLRQRLDADAAVIAQIVPEVGDRLPGLSAPPHLDPMQDRFRLFDAFSRFFRRAASDRPLVLVFDDLHRSDISSLLLLRFLTRQLSDARLLIIATYRDSRADQTEEFIRTLAELTREPVTTRLTLRGFSEDEVARFVQLARADVPIPSSFVTKLHQRTGGNPLFLKEVVLPLAEGYALADFERELDEFVPQGVHEAVERRLTYIPDRTREMLDHASVIGQQFTLEVLGEVTGLDHAQLLQLLDEVIALNYITPAIGLGQNRYRFAHVLICDALYSRLPAIRRAALHQRVGEALEKVYRGNLETRYIELAHHFQHAPFAATARKTLDYFTLAGKRAVTLLAYEEAVRLFEAALEQPADQVQRCNLLLALGDAQMRAGDSHGARAAFAQAADISRTIGNPELLGHAALGYGDTDDYGVVNQTLLDLLQEALQELDDADSQLRTRLLGRFATALYWMNPNEQRGPQELRTSLSSAAMQMAERIGEPALLASAMHARYYAVWGPDNLEERIRLADGIIESARIGGRPELLLQGRTWRLINQLECGNITEADAEIEAYLRLAEELRQPGYVFWAILWQGMRALMQGDFHLAEKQCLKALDIGRRAHDSTMVENACSSLLGSLRKDQGRLAELVPTVRSFADRFPDIPAWRIGAALADAVAGNKAAAQRELDRLATRNFLDIRRDANWFACMTLLVELCGLLRDAEHAAMLYKLLAPYERRCVVYGFATICTGSAARYLGILATILGNSALASRHFKLAIEINDNIKAIPALVYAKHDFGKSLLLEGRPDSIAAARSHLRDALGIAERLGMPHVAEQARLELS